MKVRHVDWYADEWITGTIDLDLAERGMFITACCLIYSRGGPVLPGMLRSVCHEDLRTYNRCLKRLLDLGKLDLKDGYLSNKRCLSELQRAANRSVTGEQNVSKRWKKINENNDTTSETVLPVGNANYQLPTEKKKESSPIGEPKKRGTRWLGNVSEEWVSEAATIRADSDLPTIDARLEAVKFADFWLGSGKTKLNWHATWRNWVRNARSTTGGTNGRRTPAEGIYAGFAAALGDREADRRPDSAVVIPLLGSGRA